MFRFNFPVRVRRRPCCLGLGCEAIRFRAAAYSRFAGRDVNLRAVVRLFGVDLLCAAEFKALCDSWFAR